MPIFVKGLGNRYFMKSQGSRLMDKYNGNTY